eukprot:8041549-Alexandrium_andersonii.AAC.1
MLAAVRPSLRPLATPNVPTPAAGRAGSAEDGGLRGVGPPAVEGRPVVPLTRSARFPGWEWQPCE